METKFTKGKFKDGTKGWKINKLGQHWNNYELEHIEIIWSDDAECVCDVVYTEADAKLIAAAPDMFEHLQSIVDGNAFDPETGYIWLHRLEAIKNTIKKATE